MTESDEKSEDTPSNKKDSRQNSVGKPNASKNPESDKSKKNNSQSQKKASGSTTYSKVHQSAHERGKEAGRGVSDAVHRTYQGLNNRDHIKE